CADSTVVLYIETAPAPYQYQLYHDGVAVGNVKPGAGGRLEWNISPVEKGKWSVKSMVNGCDIELSEPVEIDYAPVVPDLKGETLYCAGSDVKLWVPGAESGVKYDLYRLPEDTLAVAGVKIGMQAEFPNVTAGSYYVRAKRGNCEVKGGMLKVDSVRRPVLPVIETNDCVEAGKGVMRLSGLSASSRYEITGPVNVTVYALTADTSLMDLPAGVYSVQAIDVQSGCESEMERDTIREGVPNDTLVPPFGYCEGENGAKLQLSGVHIGVAYKILTENGSVLSSLAYPQSIPQPLFSGEFGTGRYKFRVERTSFPAGCYRETLFEVVKRSRPSVQIDVTLEGTEPVCDGNGYRVRLNQTSVGVLYVLLQESPMVALDTLEGTGGSVVFADEISKAGNYLIRAVDAVGGCSVMLDTVLTIHPRPEIWAEDCEYCDTEDSGCSIVLRRMENDVLYRLDQLDTLRGTGSGSFKKQSAGDYIVIAENEKTGCRSADSVTIAVKRGPNVYALVLGCYKPEESFDIQMTGSDAGVDYFLYCDATAVSSDATKGTGNALSFGHQEVTGVYRVKAVSDNGCTATMRDSVIVYPPLPVFEAEVKGSFCNGDTTGVSLLLKQTAKSWKYYITNGYLRSDTLQRIDGGILAWNKLYNGPSAVSVLNGVYYFHAISPCGADEEIGSLNVTGDELPQKFPLVDKPLYYCAPESFSIALSGSEAGMKYVVKRYLNSGSLAEIYPAVVGDGVTVPFVLGKFNNPGYYEIIADNGCPRQLEFWEVKGSRLPEICSITGENVCRQTDADSLSVAVSF
ncbi:MAG: hypothetical protein K2I47_05920, partial [Odoribacter sp.]|nr:hypothetical protein [Odoribacter sp.]